MLRTRKWTDKDGVEKYSTEITATDMQLLGGREGQGSGGEEGSMGETQQRPAGAPRSAPAARPAPSKPAAAKSATGFDDMDDDIPF